MRWFTADLHLGHEKIIDLCNRPFSDADHMNRAIIARWNETVGDGDTVWILGDLALGQLVQSLPLVEQLRGEKVLVPGNHDRVHPMMADGSPKKYAKFQEMLVRYRDVGLKIADHNTTLRMGGQWVQVSHFPPQGDHQIAGERFLEWRPSASPTDPVVHGHVHTEWKQRGRWVNVGVDVWDFRPVPEDDLVRIFES